MSHSTPKAALHQAGNQIDELFMEYKSCLLQAELSDVAQEAHVTHYNTICLASSNHAAFSTQVGL